MASVNYHTVETLYNALKQFGQDQKIGMSEEHVRWVKVTFSSTTCQKNVEVESNDEWNNLDFVNGNTSTVSGVVGYLAGLLPEHTKSTVTISEQLFTLPEMTQISPITNSFTWKKTGLNPYLRLELIQQELNQLVTLLFEFQQEPSTQTTSPTSQSSSSSTATDDIKNIISVIGGWVQKKCKNDPELTSIIRIYRVGTRIYSSLGALKLHYPCYLEELDDTVFKVHKSFPFIQTCKMNSPKMSELFGERTKETLLKQIEHVMQMQSS